MSRLIDVDNAFETFKSLPRCENGYSDTYDIETIIGILQDEPIIDAVEVVRCKHCKHFSYKGVPFAKEHGLGTCSRIGEGLQLTKVDGYCFLGEKVKE